LFRGSLVLPLIRGTLRGLRGELGERMDGGEGEVADLEADLLREVASTPNLRPKKHPFPPFPAVVA